MASAAYSAHVGVNRHAAGKYGETITLYARIATRSAPAARPARRGRGAVSRCEGGTVIGLKAVEEGIEHFPPWNDDDIDAFVKLVTPEYFPGEALGPVPIDRWAQLARCRHAEACGTATVGHDEHRHVSSLDPRSGRVGALEVGAAANVLGSGETLSRCRVHRTARRAVHHAVDHDAGVRFGRFARARQPIARLRRSAACARAPDAA